MRKRRWGLWAIAVLFLLVIALATATAVEPASAIVYDADAGGWRGYYLFVDSDVRVTIEIWREGVLIQQVEIDPSNRLWIQTLGADRIRLSAPNGLICDDRATHWEEETECDFGYQPPEVILMPLIINQ